MVNKGVPLQFVGVCLGVSATKDGTKIYARFPAPMHGSAPKGSEQASLGFEVTQDQAVKCAVGREYKVTAQMFKHMERVEYAKGGGGMHDRYVFELVALDPVAAPALAGAR